MGEAKRRTQALGERYGNTPPVLINGSEQLEEHIEKFAHAYFEKFDELNQMHPLPADFGDGNDLDIRAEKEKADKVSTEIQTWLLQYLATYRSQDREKLAMGMIEPFYSNLFNSTEEELETDPEEGMSQFMLKLMVCLSCFDMLKPYLSQDNQDFYAEPMCELYFELLDDIKENESDPDERAESIENLPNLFLCCLDDEDLIG